MKQRIEAVVESTVAVDDTEVDHLLRAAGMAVVSCDISGVSPAGCTHESLREGFGLVISAYRIAAQRVPQRACRMENNLAGIAAMDLSRAELSYLLALAMEEAL